MKIRIKETVIKCAGVAASFLVKVWKFVQRVITVNTLSLVVAAIAAYISYRALNESVVQREAMYRPELYVGETRFYADLTDRAGIKYYRVDHDTVVKKEPVREPWMRINNVGMGSALHVEGTVDLRPEVMSEAMKAMKVKQEGVCHTYAHGDDTLKLGGVGGFRWHKDYILPLHQSQDECTLDLTRLDFDNMIKAALWLNGVLHSQFQGFIIPVELKYKDINDKWYTKKSWMQVQCYTEEDKTGVNCRICSGIAQKEFMDEYDKYMNGRKVSCHGF